MEFDRGVATITLNRPRQRNAVGEGMREELADAYRFCDRAAVGAREPTSTWRSCVTTTPGKGCGHFWSGGHRCGQAAPRIRPATA
jgi:hypothetical protein